MKIKNNRVQNWGRTLDFSPEKISHPASEEEFIELVNYAALNEKRIRIVGSGHSWTHLITTDSILVSLDKYQGLIKVDPKSHLAIVKAGTKLKLLGELLYENGLALENMGDIDVQSLAGALNTGTHGTGINFGTLSTQVHSLKLLTASGEILTCSEEENKEIFKAAQVSLGALGVILEYTIKCIPAFNLEYICDKEPLEQCLDNLDMYNRENRHFEFYWFPYTEIVQTKFVNEVPEVKKHNKWMKKFNDLIVDNYVFMLISELTRLFPRISKSMSKLSAAGVSTGSYSDHSHRIFATERLVKFYEMEYNIPREHFKTVMLEIKKCIEQEQFEVHFPLECRFVKSDDIMISPANGRDSAYIAVHMYKGMEYRAYFNALEKIFQKYNGRPHYGKMNTFTHDDFCKAHPQWDEFKKLRNMLDPNGTFINDYLQTLFNI